MPREQANSRNQPAPRVGNLARRRRDVVPDSMGSSQSTPRVGNQNGRRREVVPDSMGSTSQLTPGVQASNQNGRRRDVVLGSRGSGSGSQQNQSGTSRTTRSNCQPSRRSPSPGPNETSVLARQHKRPRRSTIQTRAYIEPGTEPDGQEHLETVHLSDDSSDAYQNPGDADETESDTEPDTEALDIEEDTASARRHGSQAGQQGNSGPMTVRISTTSGSQEVSLVRRTPVARGRIIRGRAYSPPMFPSSSTGRYSPPLATHSTTTPGGRNASPLSEPGTPIGSPIDSRRNTVTGAEGAILGKAMSLMLGYTLFDDPLPNAVALTSRVYTVWSKAQDAISDAGYTDPSEESLKLVS